MIPNAMKSMATPLQSTLMHSLKLGQLSPLPGEIGPYQDVPQMYHYRLQANQTSPL